MCVCFFIARFKMSSFSDSDNGEEVIGIEADLGGLDIEDGSIDDNGFYAFLGMFVVRKHY